MGSCSAVGFAGIEVGCIQVGCKDHVADMVENSIIWICGAVVKKMIESFVGGFAAVACWVPISLRA